MLSMKDEFSSVRDSIALTPQYLLRQLVSYLSPISDHNNHDLFPEFAWLNKKKG